MYEYRAVVTKVYDGDTITVDIDLGLGVWIRNESLRLARINAPEIRGDQRAEGLRCRDALAAKLMGKEITIQTKKDRTGKYGRYICEILFEDENINNWMLRNGFAKEY